MLVPSEAVLVLVLVLVIESAPELRRVVSRTPHCDYEHRSAEHEHEHEYEYEKWERRRVKKAGHVRELGDVSGDWGGRSFFLG